MAFSEQWAAFVVRYSLLVVRWSLIAIRCSKLAVRFSRYIDSQRARRKLRPDNLWLVKFTPTTFHFVGRREDCWSNQWEPFAVNLPEGLILLFLIRSRLRSSVLSKRPALKFFSVGSVDAVSSLQWKRIHQLQVLISQLRKVAKSLSPSLWLRWRTKLAAGSRQDDQSIAFRNCTKQETRLTACRLSFSGGARLTAKSQQLQSFWNLFCCNSPNNPTQEIPF